MRIGIRVNIAFALGLLSLITQWGISALKTIAVIHKYDDKEYEYMIWNNNTKNDVFTYTESELNKCDCEMVWQYILSYNQTQTMIRIELDNSDMLNEISNTNSRPDLVSVNYSHSIKQNQSNNNNNTTIDLVINHQCIATALVKDDYAILSFSFNIANAVNNQTGISDYSFDMLKSCIKEPGYSSNKANELITSICLLALALFTVYYCTNIKLSIKKKSRKGNSSNKKSDNKISYKYLINMIIIGSCLLLFIFKFIKYYIVKTLFSLIFAVLLFSAMSSIIDILYHNRKLKMRLAFLNKVIIYQYTLYSIVNPIISAIVVLYYLMTRHWILNNIFAFILCYLSLQLPYIPNFKISSFALFILCLYDIFWVYISPFVFNGNVMQTAAMELQAPIKMVLPRFFWHDLYNPCFLLGLGDIVMPGFTIKFCKRFDFIQDKRIYYYTSLLLYLFALILSEIALFSFDHPQPVILFMFPCLIFGIGIVAYTQNDFWLIWNADKEEEKMLIRKTMQQIQFSELELLKSKDIVINVPRKTKKRRRENKKLRHRRTRRIPLA